MAKRLPVSLRVRQEFLPSLVSWLVGLDGLFVLATTLLEQINTRHGSRLDAIVVDVPLILGLGFLYLSTLLARRKRNAWLVAVVSYAFMLGLNTMQLLDPDHHHLTGLVVTRALVVPLVVLLSLALSQRAFSVRSDFDVFRTSLRISVIVLLATLAYGVGGFLLLDKSDFHQEITVPGAFQRTIDQFDLTTNKPLRPYTKRAKLFTDSLSFVSVGSLVYVAISFFQPVRSRLRNQSLNRQRMLSLLEKERAPSEDFFKLWPHDKLYFFDSAEQAGTAFTVRGGVALNLGDPVGKPARLKALLNEFDTLCFVNDWLPAFLHVEAKHQKLYEAFGYNLQLIGQEAVVDIAYFGDQVARNKYFRNITNRFNKADYQVELLTPPHSSALINRLRQVSAEWLDRPARSERGFVMGYFNEAYLQQCDVLVARDAAHTIQGFINLIPAPFDNEELTFDMMRHTAQSLANINDFMLLNLIAHARDQGFKRLNLGLSPLVGLDTEEANGLITSALRFAYVNGDRFYSFSGLHRFKDKYEPVWSDRYIAYKGGVRGFSRTMNALLRAMRVSARS